MDRVIAGWGHDKAILRIDKALFIPDALVSSLFPTPPRKALWRLRLSWRKREVEQMVQRLTRRHLGGALWRQSLTLPLLAGHLLI